MPKHKGGYLPRQGANALKKLQAIKKGADADRTVVCCQMCLDAAMIAANEVLGLGEGRVEAFAAAYKSAVQDIGKMWVEDAEADAELVYSKAKLDERIKKICGSHFEPFDARYPGKGRQ